MTVSFYRETADHRLRFGDVLSGYILGSLRQKDTVAHSVEAPRCPLATPPLFTVDLILPAFCVLLTPCCSIGKGTTALVVSPLRPVEKYWLETPYLAEDLTRVNQKAMPNVLTHPATWAKMTDEKQGREMEKGLGYGYAKNFAYAGNKHFSPYEVKLSTGDVTATNWYMLNFLDIYMLNCENIRKDKGEFLYPPDSKLLQLSARVRTELRLKMATFFLGRNIEEDIAEDSEVAVILKSFGFA